MFNNSGSGRASIISPAIKVIMIINAVFFIFSFLLSDYSIGSFYPAAFMYKYFALFPLGDGNPYSTFFPWQLITYQFMHASFSHLFFNLFSLWMFGSEVEYHMGSKKFLVFFLLSGIGAGLIQLATTSIAGTFGATVGASGAVYGVLVAFAVLNPDRRVMIIPIPIPIKSKVMVSLMIAFDLILGLTDSGNVAHFAHLGGALTGFLIARFGDMVKIYRNLSRDNRYNAYEDKIYSSNTTTTKYWQKEREDRNENVYPAQGHNSSTSSTINNGKMVVDGEDITQKTIDEILDKISANGYAGLSEREKKILVELSKNLR